MYIGYHLHASLFSSIHHTSIIAGAASVIVTNSILQWFQDRRSAMVDLWQHEKER